MRACSFRGPLDLPLLRPLALTLTFAGTLLLATACGDTATPTEPKQDDPPPVQTDPNRSVGSVGSAGGSVSLPDGTTVVFPAGALAGTTQVTVERVDPTRWFDSGGEGERVVISTKASVSTFAQEVEIRVPLPSGMTEGDSSLVFAGLIDDESGAIEAEAYRIRIIDGKPFLVVSTNHFSNRIYEWFSGKWPPPAAGPLPTPYYSQGSSNYCWAASLQMVTRAVRHETNFTIPEIIGAVGVDPGGITQAQFRDGSGVAGVVRDRTGGRPLRKTYNRGNVRTAKDDIRREIGVNGRPVALYHAGWDHVVVVVGYDGDTFFVHDPASTNDASVGYTARPWSAIGGTVGYTENLVTLVVPAPPTNDAHPVRVNILQDALTFTKPFEDEDNPSALYRYRWDHTRRDGYAFKHPSSGDVANPLPGTTQTLSVTGDIHISNASRTESKEVSVWVHISAMGVPTGTGHFSYQETVNVGPNGVKRFAPPPIPVDTFRANRLEPTEYFLTVSALVDGTQVDHQSLVFRVGTVVPEIKSVTPGGEAVGELVLLKGKRFGSGTPRDSVTFNGTKATDIVSWSEDEIVVRVPEGATTGPLVVHRGEVPSEGLPFNVLTYVVIREAVQGTWSLDAGTRTQRVSGEWVFQADGARIVVHEPETNYYSMQLRHGSPGQVRVSLTPTIEPEYMSVTLPGGTVRETTCTPALLTELTPYGQFAWDRSGGDESLALNLYMTHRSHSFAVQYAFLARCTWKETKQDGTPNGEGTYETGWRNLFVLYIQPE
jgi:hypothetical protein